MDNGYYLSIIFFYSYCEHYFNYLIIWNKNLICRKIIRVVKNILFSFVIRHLLKAGIKYCVLIIDFIDQYQKYNKRISMCTISNLQILYFAL